ncbi:uncharacterized protein LOC131039008 [Cryptomeria japonica]|uniref:uncharacterized protein LOC131039008 n=1 Tax=Cryptomeria japonica TaxID=3369 RepID=UPI0025ABD031|nr:uncharacterized protein LOC131039008 [Cryptomeria japonica]
MESFVIVHNVAKRHNIGTLARSATAFGVSELILVGRKDFNAFGSHGSTLHINFRHFYSLQHAQQYLKGKDCDICGVEIADGALAVHEHPFRKSTAFLLGNEGTGLSSKEMEICDFFVYISQYGCGTASLNVTIAASIVLHHFAVWAGFPERRRDGQKFVVAEKPARQVWAGFPERRRDGQKFVVAEKPARQVWAGFPERRRDGQKFVVAEKPARQGRRNFCAESIEVIAKERKDKKEAGSHDWLDDAGTDRSNQHNERIEESFSCMLEIENNTETSPLDMLFHSDL